MSEHTEQTAEHTVDAGRGVELTYRTHGDPSGSPMLLIAGWSQQLLMWPEPIIDGLVDAGFHVIRFDNRDVGRSTRIKARPPRPTQLATRRFNDAQYDLADMARDTDGLLDALEIEHAHVVGVSMGGMIAQTLAARHASRVRSLTSIMSTVGGVRHGQPALSTYRWILSRPPATREQAADRFVQVMRHIGSVGFPFDADRTRQIALDGWDRAGGDQVAGGARQLAAILKSGNRTRELAHVTAPTLVIHGDRDRMVHPSGGAATARAIRGARLETIEGMGHDLPTGAHERILRLIREHAATADG